MTLKALRTHVARSGLKVVMHREIHEDHKVTVDEKHRVWWAAFQKHHVGDVVPA